MRIYRIESQEGQGPYREMGNPLPWSYFKDTDRHPEPGRDGVMWGMNLHFGHASRRSLREWWTADMWPYLAEADYQVSIYEVPKEQVRRGQKQVAFAMGAARRVLSLPIGKDGNELLNPRHASAKRVSHKSLASLPLFAFAERQAHSSASD